MVYGNLILSAVGEENLYLSNQPEITFFKIVYKKYTNFSTEHIPQYFKITPDFGRRVTVNLSKNADLINDIYLYIKLPSLSVSNHSFLPSNVKKVRWVEKIGLAMVRFIDLEIGGILIDRQYGDWLNIWHELTNNIGHKEGYKKMIGNIESNNNFTDGKDKYTIHVPLNFWFCKNSGISLPVIALKHHDVKIHVEFNDFNNCIKESPNHYLEINSPICLFQENEIIKQEVDGRIYSGEFIHFDISTQRVYYNKIKGEFQIPSSTSNLYKITGQTSKFESDPKPGTQVIKDEDYFYSNDPSIESAYLLVNYVYLDNMERYQFMHNDHEYLVTTVQNIAEQTLNNTNTTYKIPLVNPNKAIFWRCILKSNSLINDNFNYTSYPLTDEYDNLIEKHSIIVNSIKRVEINTWEYYNYVQNYQSNFSSPQKGIYSYSFCINPLKYEPSGSLNFSKIDDSYLQLTMNSKVNYQNPVSIKLYGLQYNVFKVTNGLGGLKYAL